MTACPLVVRTGPAARRARVSGLLALAIAGSLLGFSSPARGEDGPKLYVHLETPGLFQYSGDPVQISILFKNEGKAQWVNPGIDIEAGLQMFDSAGTKLEHARIPAASRDGQPKILEPNAFFGKIINLSQHFPKTNSVGTYRITWSAPDIPEQSLATRIIKKDRKSVV